MRPSVKCKQTYTKTTPASLYAEETAVFNCDKCLLLNACNKMAKLRHFVNLLHLELALNHEQTTANAIYYVHATVFRDALYLIPPRTPNKQTFYIKLWILIALRFNCVHMLTKLCRAELNLTLRKSPARKFTWSFTATPPYVFTIRCLITGTRFLSRRQYFFENYPVLLKRKTWLKTRLLSYAFILCTYCKQKKNVPSENQSPPQQGVFCFATYVKV